MSATAMKFESVDGQVFYDADLTCVVAQPIRITASILDLPAMYLEAGKTYQVMFRFCNWWPFNFWVPGESFDVPDVNDSQQPPDTDSKSR